MYLWPGLSLLLLPFRPIVVAFFDLRNKFSVLAEAKEKAKAQRDRKIKGTARKSR